MAGFCECLYIYLPRENELVIKSAIVLLMLSCKTVVFKAFHRNVSHRLTYILLADASGYKCSLSTSLFSRAILNHEGVLLNAGSAASFS